MSQECDNKRNFTFEGRLNIVGFYDLLLKVDKRENPHLYQNLNTQPYARHDNSDNTQKQGSER